MPKLKAILSTTFPRHWSNPVLHVQSRCFLHQFNQVMHQCKIVSGSTKFCIGSKILEI
ncbi:hypothetical protein A2U01_0035218, partial [Trifolium medium]|nr:hypothetical protein [Trifolium medium]